MNLAEYLKEKQLEYCNKERRIVTEAEWVKEVLNPQLPGGDRLSYASVNQWMNNDRNPDSKNVIRLIQIFGPEVMPYLGIKFYGELGHLIDIWYDLPPEVQQDIHGIVKKNCAEKKALQS